MTDSILRSYQTYTHTSLVPFPFVEPPPPVASDWLSGETQGWAFDATSYDEATAAAYVGGPVGGTVACTDTGTPANNLSDVALDLSNLTNAGTSPTTVYWAEAPYVRWAPHNLCLQSQTFNTTWAGDTFSVSSNSTTAPDGTSTADTITATAGSGFHYLRVLNTVVSGRRLYTYSCWLKKNTHRYVLVNTDDNSSAGTGILVDLNDGSIINTSISTGSSYVYVSSTTTDAGSGWYRFTMTFTAASGTSMNAGLYIWPDSSTSTWAPTWSAAGTETFYAWGALLNYGANPTPYLATTSAAKMGISQGYDILNEEYGILSQTASTNLLRSSEVFSTWTVTNVSLSSVAAPDGTTLATRVTNDAVNSDHRLGKFADFTYTAGANTFSLYAKAGTTNWLQMFAYDGVTFYYANFNLTNGAIGNKQASVTAETLAIGGGWYRCILKTSGLTGGAASNCQIYILEADTASAGPSYAGTSKYFDVWGGQFENYVTATSYIPTGTSASVTRAADQIGFVSTTGPTFTTELGLWYQGTYVTKSGSGAGAVGYADNGGVSTRNFFYLESNTFVNAFSENSNISTGTPTVNVAFKAAGRWKLNDFHGALNGTLAGTPDTSGAMTGQGQGCWIGTLNGALGMVMYIHRLVMVPRAYTNVELQSKSTL